eukprot:5917567-Amphidinium_carterae.2
MVTDGGSSRTHQDVQLSQYQAGVLAIFYIDCLGHRGRKPTVSNDSVMMPAPMIGGGFSSETLSSTHATRWLKEILCAGGEAFLMLPAYRRTHLSARETLLSWAAKYGLDRETRQILGYHMVSGSRSALHYSRHEQASPLRHVLRVVNAVAYGNFHPDAGRLGIIPGDV